MIFLEYVKINRCRRPADYFLLAHTDSIEGFFFGLLRTTNIYRRHYFYPRRTQTCNKSTRPLAEKPQTIGTINPRVISDSARLVSVFLQVFLVLNLYHYQRK